jgi:hypothetical protein
MYILKYLLYVLEHKWNVFKIAMGKGMFVHAFTHDLSKLTGSEFWAYAGYFYKDKEKYKHRFEMAWRHHYYNNPHHWNHWIDPQGKPMEIPLKYIQQMVVDWEAMSLKFGDTAKEYYLNNKEKIKLTDKTRTILENELEI